MMAFLVVMYRHGHVILLKLGILLHILVIELECLLQVAKASSAAEGLTRWIQAMEIYDRVAKVVAPKKAKLKEAQSQLAETMALLNTKRAELKAVQDRLANLEQTFQEMVDKKKNLEFQVRRSCSLYSVLQS